jgi:non-homologous end joining protein Ku
MTSKGTRGTAIDFGGYELSDADRVDEETGEITTVPTKTTMSGVAGSRTPAPGVYKAVRLSEEKVIRLPEDDLVEIVEHSLAAYETMQVLETIDYRSVPTERIIGTYYLQPRAGTAKGCRMFFEALRQSELVAVVKWVGSSREKLGVIRARVVNGKSVLHLSELAFGDDMLEPDEDISLDDVEVGEKAITAAVTLVDGFRRKHGAEKQIDTATDTAVNARIALVERLADTELDEALSASVEHATAR